MRGLTNRLGRSYGSLLTLFVLMSAGALAQHERVHLKEDRQLKLFRAYYSLVYVYPLQHSFEVWFRPTKQSRRHYCQVFLTRQRVATLRDDFPEAWHCDWDGRSVPRVPASVGPVPLAVRDLADAIRISARNQFGAAALHELAVAYSGEAHLAEIEERIPQGMQSNDRGRRLFQTNAVFALDRDLTRVEYVGGSRCASDYSLKVPCAKARASIPCDGTRSYIRFVLPKAAEGRSLLSGYYRGRRNANTVELERSLLHTARHWLSGSYRNPLDDLLLRQGNSLLPEDFQQQGELRLRLHRIDAAGNESAVEPPLTLTFSVSEAYVKGVQLRGEWKQDGVTLRLALNLKSRTLDIEAQSGPAPVRSVVSRHWPLAGEDLIVDDDSIAIPGSWSVTGGSDGLDLPLWGGGKLRVIAAGVRAKMTSP